MSKQTLAKELTEEIRGYLSDRTVEFEQGVIFDVVKGRVWQVSQEELAARFAELITEYPLRPPLGEYQTAFEWSRSPSEWHRQLAEYLVQAVKDELDDVPAGDRD